MDEKFERMITCDDASVTILELIAFNVLVNLRQYILPLIQHALTGHIVYARFPAIMQNIDTLFFANYMCSNKCDAKHSANRFG